MHYKNDFRLPIRLRDDRGVPYAVPEYDFTVTLRSGLSSFEAGRRDGILYNCVIDPQDDSRLMIIADGHELTPSPRIICEVELLIPDEGYEDGTRRVVHRFDTGLPLEVNPACAHLDVSELETLLPLIKGDQGEKGDKGERGDKGEKGDQGDPIKVVVVAKTLPENPDPDTLYLVTP